MFSKIILADYIQEFTDSENIIIDRTITECTIKGHTRFEITTIKHSVTTDTIWLKDNYLVYTSTKKGIIGTENKTVRVGKAAIPYHHIIEFDIHTPTEEYLHKLTWSHAPGEKTPEEHNEEYVDFPEIAPIQTNQEPEES